MSGTKTTHTEEEIDRATKLAEEFDPSSMAMDDMTDLRALAETVDAVRVSEARVRELVARARGDGRSWGEIGIALGVSRQAAPRALRGADPHVGSAFRARPKLPPRAIRCFASRMPEARRLPRVLRPR